MRRRGLLGLVALGPLCWCGLAHAGSYLNRCAILVAAANRDPMANPDPHLFRPGRADPQVFTFGQGAHRCPGHVVAAAITIGVTATVTGAPSHEGYRPSPNARIPVLKGQLG